MNKDKYFVITTYDDGLVHINVETEEAIIKNITPDENGYSEYGQNVKFLDYMPDYNDGYLNLGEDEVIIIKGDFIVPKEKKVITQYEL